MSSAVFVAIVQEYNRKYTNWTGVFHLLPRFLDNTKWYTPQVTILHGNR